MRTSPPIALSAPDVTESEIAAVQQVLRTPYLSGGPAILQFEQAFARYAGTRHAIAVNAGTSGLHLAVIAAGIGEGDEVITSSFSFIASANCILYQRARPVFVDVDPRTGNLAADAVAAAITERTRAIIAVHAFGQPADMDPIMAIARRHGILVLEDACEAIGAEYKGRRVGTLSDAAVFAFYPNKQMTTGEGGMVVTDHAAWDPLMRSLRNQGRAAGDAEPTYVRLGYNYRMDEMSAALGLAQLQRIDELLGKRARVAAQYDAWIEGIAGLRTPVIAATTTRMSWFVYVIRCQPHVDRARLMAYLRERQIASRVYFTPIHLQPLYRDRFGCRRGELPCTEALGDQCLALPFSSVMGEEDVAYVCTQLRRGVEVCAR